MTEEEARGWIAERFDVPRETWAVLEAYVAFLVEESGRQNLIAASTVGCVWARHIVDSAQLLLLCTPAQAGVQIDGGTGPRPAPGDGEGAGLSWIDLGAGAGLPGLVIAALSEHRVTLVESRRKRIEFLEEAARRMGLADRVSIVGTRLEVMPTAPFDIIGARAFAPLDKLLGLAHRFSHGSTVWLLPKGKSAESELAAARRTWQGDFRVMPSVTDPDAGILIAGKVQPRTGR